MIEMVLAHHGSVGLSNMIHKGKVETSKRNGVVPKHST
jgi:hypothetical protein